MSDRRTYVESPIIMATVRLVAPFVLTYGLFITLHGASSPGGGFQGGVIVASVIVMLSFAYGIDATWEWLDKRVLVGITTGGIAVFAALALGPILAEPGADFLELGALPLIPNPWKYGIELVEVGIAMTVAGVVIVLFFQLARGAMPPGGSPYAMPSAGPTGEERRGDSNTTERTASGTTERTASGTTERTASGTTERTASGPDAVDDGSPEPRTGASNSGSTDGRGDRR
ncbi:MnhB domain-containing protein [Halovivax cerinus]|uniref:MnhB domain-containing protein n=1 Tax=Halovivax cerinus TaxID=1487865 RepID=A0ABD5NMT8_9EURY|nr:MnhB domain-containing protein [Halovivax cerinus]